MVMSVIPVGLLDHSKMMKRSHPFSVDIVNGSLLLGISLSILKQHKFKSQKIFVSVAIVVCHQFNESNF